MQNVATFLGEQGIPDEVADRVLNHARPGVGNQHYNHAKMLPQVRAALELWAEYVEAACAEVATTQAVGNDDPNHRVAADASADRALAAA